MNKPLQLLVKAEILDNFNSKTELILEVYASLFHEFKSKKKSRAEMKYS